MKMTITQPRKVQIPKFCCLKSSTNIWQSCGNIYSIPKTQKIDWEGKQISKLAKIGQFFALKKLKMNFLKNFPGFYFKSFLCFFLYVSMNFSHWQNLCDTPNLVRSLHRHRVTDGFKSNGQRGLKTQSLSSWIWPMLRICKIVFVQS